MIDILRSYAKIFGVKVFLAKAYLKNILLKLQKYKQSLTP